MFNKIANITAAEVVEQSRRAATAFVSFIPHEETKDALSKVFNLQCNFADIYATQIDKAAASLKKSWAFPV